MPDHAPPTVVVAGLGRCGLTMVARMLDAGGLTVSGDPPSYEEPLYEIDWSADVVKLVDPVGNEYSGLLPEYRELQWIWMMRDAKQQARSMAHLLELADKKAEPRRLQKSIRPSTRKSWRWIEESRGEQLTKLRFEDAIQQPEAFTLDLDDTLPWAVDVEKMWAVIDDRDAKHEGDLSRELDMIR